MGILEDLLNFPGSSTGGGNQSTNGYNMMNSPEMGGNGQANSLLSALSNNNNAGGGGNGIMDFFLGDPSKGQAGTAVPLMNSLSGLAGSYLGMKQYGLAKDAFKESKRQFQLNYDAQKKDYNSSISDRQKARRLSAGSGADKYDSQAEYMKKWGI